MKLILNNSILEITSRQRENRNKKVVNYGINSSGNWVLSVNNEGYFIDAKIGDVIYIEKGSSTSRAVLVLTSSNEPVDGQAVPFANETTGRLVTFNTLTLNIQENCFLYVVEKDTNVDYKPNKILINNIPLSEDGWL